MQDKLERGFSSFYKNKKNVLLVSGIKATFIFTILAIIFFIIGGTFSKYIEGEGTVRVIAALMLAITGTIISYGAVISFIITLLVLVCPLKKLTPTHHYLSIVAIKMDHEGFVYSYKKEKNKLIKNIFPKTKINNCFSIKSKDIDIRYVIINKTTKQYNFILSLLHEILLFGFVKQKYNNTFNFRGFCIIKNKCEVINKDLKNKCFKIDYVENKVLIFIQDDKVELYSKELSEKELNKKREIFKHIIM